MDIVRRQVDILVRLVRGYFEEWEENGFAGQTGKGDDCRCLAGKARPDATEVPGRVTNPAERLHT